MGNAYPNAFTQNDLGTLKKFLNSPTLIARRYDEIALNQFIGDYLLTGRPNVEGGAIQYESQGTEVTDRPVESISPGAEYPLALIGDVPAQIAKTDKRGQDSLVTDEKLKRERRNAIDRAITALVNSNVIDFDSTVLALVASVVTQEQTITTAWSASGATILRDILLAKGKITGQKKGYNPNVVVMSDEVFAYVASDTAIAALMARESKANAVYTGEFPVIAGLEVRTTPNMPTGIDALVADRQMLGGVGYEDLGGGYTRTQSGAETKSMREDQNDQWRLRARRVAVPYVTDPGAACVLDGVLA
ncbi:hypothetical protein [Cumulibacter soli]|uniref:phage major capsid protein n=1 Tax=Cumulibacter soli TaxID=2546344 RepID=UPI001067EB7A|nr:hypothetical protein [Cumulibacter soli]